MCITVDGKYVSGAQCVPSPVASMLSLRAHTHTHAPAVAPRYPGDWFWDPHKRNP